MFEKQRCCTVAPCDCYTSHEVKRSRKAGVPNKVASAESPEVQSEALLSRTRPCAKVLDMIERAYRELGAYLCPPSTGLPGLRCASMPFPMEVIFNCRPGLEADWFSALEALLEVAAEDMGVWRCGRG